MAFKNPIHKALMQRADAVQAISLCLGQEWDGTQNVECPLAAERHEGGEDSTPSLSINPSTGACFCHACGFKASSFVGLYQEVNGLPYSEAMEQLWDFLIEKIVPASDVQQAHRALITNELILLRLDEKRGIKPDTAKQFNLGWRGNRLWIPILNDQGMVVDVRRHDILKRLSKGMKVLPYRKGFGAARLFPRSNMGSPSILLCEGELDTILAIQEGVPAVCITSGAMVWPEELTSEFEGKRITIIPDNDKAGRDGASRRSAALSEVAKSVKVVKLPVKKKGEDLTDWILDYSGDPKTLSSITKKTRKVKRASEGGPKFEPTIDIAMSQREQAQLEKADSVLDWLSGHGAFYCDDQGGLFYAPNNGPEAIRMGGGRDSYFTAYLNRRSSGAINQATADGRFVLNHVMSAARFSATLTQMGAWCLYSDPGVIYIYSGENKIIRVDSSSAKEIPNAVNEDKVLIEAPRESSAVKFDKKASISDAVNMFWKDVMENIPCDESSRYLIMCWTVGVLFREYIRPKPLLRFTAKTAGGKSTSSKLLTYLIYGEEMILRPSSTDAATSAYSRSHPLLVFDNVETRNLTTAFEEFLLGAATGGTKIKRKADTDMGVISEKTNCLVVTNGIEPFARHELINRNVEILLDKELHGRKDFNEYRILKQIVKDRDAIISGLLRMSKEYVFTRIQEGEVSRIAHEFGSHAMDRFNDYFGLMALFLDAIWAFRPCKDSAIPTPNAMTKRWLDSQDSSAVEQKRSTNEVIYFLNELVDRGPTISMDLRIQLNEKNGVVSFECQTRTLLTDFRILARHINIRCPWESERQLGARIADAEEVLKQEGWTRTVRRVQGHRLFEYTYQPEKPKKKKVRRRKR